MAQTAPSQTVPETPVVSLPPSKHTTQGRYTVTTTYFSPDDGLAESVQQIAAEVLQEGPCE